MPRIERPTTRELGAEGEDRAARYLVGQGYRIVGRNVRAGGVEIDLVAQRRGTAVFVEVKTRRSSRHGAPEAAVDWAKRRRLVRGAAAWLAAGRRPTRAVRFDVIAWLVERDELDGTAVWRLTHYEGAFDASD